MTDSIVILVFEEAQFTHFPLSYFTFKYPQMRKTLSAHKSSSAMLLPLSPAINQILMSPGTQLQVRTNFDNQASKITYELKFYQHLTKVGSSDDHHFTQQQQYCSNITIQINKDGLLSVAALKQSQLKSFHECTATLLVTIFINVGTNADSKTATTTVTKQQTLVYTIRVKPIVYAMLKLNQNSVVKLTESVCALLEFIINRSFDLQMILKNSKQFSTRLFALKRLCYKYLF